MTSVPGPCCDLDFLDTLCPLHVVLASTGHVRRVGPCLQKLRPNLTWTGARFLEILEVKRPQSIFTLDDLKGVLGRKLHLELRDAPRTALKGIATTDGGDGIVVNLSFGISILDAVQEYDLTVADFAATDLAIEMLYLIEAKSAAMEASRKLNLRLEDARNVAEKKAFTDTLTGLGNRRALTDTLERMVEQRHPLTVMHIDLDYFKEVNDTYGHLAGDHVLETVAAIFLSESRSSDHVVRLGGDEFVIVLPGVPNPDWIAAVGERLVERIEEPVSLADFGADTCQISCSIGVCMWNGKTPTSEATLIGDADIALYASKRNGRAQLTFYEPALRENVEGYQLPEDTGIEMIELWQASH